VLAFDDIHVSLGGRPVLRGVDLRVDGGRTLALVGPSGCGKSTLLRVALGLVRPDRGRVTVDGRPVDPDDRASRHRVGTVIQEGGLFPHLTARGNATLLADHLRRPPSETAARLDELAALTRLEPALLERHPDQLSGGQRQRVALIRALMLRPPLLLLDEPLGALDPLVRSELQDDLRAIFRAVGATVVLVTHDLAEAAFFGDQIAVMMDGALPAVGAPDDILAAPDDTPVGRFVRAQRATHLVR
jgi:osmoprotectant transport system ATP-binding protein